MFSWIRRRGISFFPLVAQVGGVVFSPRTWVAANSDRLRERETEKENLFPYGNFALRLVKIFAQMHYPSVCRGRERERAGESEWASGVCATVLFPTQPRLSLFSLSLSLSLSPSLLLPIYRGARPCAGYIDRERNIDPSQRRRALTAHHLHTYIINAPTTVTAPRPVPARRRCMFLLFAKSFRDQV